MPTIKQATGGGTTHPKISLTFYDDEEETYYEIIRDINEYEKGEEGLKGAIFEKSVTGTRKKNVKQIETLEEIKAILNRFEFTYIESINVIVPELINDISEEVIDAQYDKVKFSYNKKQLKESYDAYIDGLTEILNAFADDISGTFKEFQPMWSVKFDVPKNSDSFRELISNDVSLQLDDSGSIGIEDKGAGLQRLAAILLQFELLTRKKYKRNKWNIVCIDEPDVYIHEGLQKKLKHFLDTKTNNSQIFLTTHSRVFLNQYSMKNVFLFDAQHRKQYSVRRKKQINVVETFLVDINTDDGYKKICEHLGIEIKTYDPLKQNNLLVEGGCDARYISELGKFFELKIPNIITLDGDNNAEKYLDFYNSFYKDSERKPNIKLVLDNDEKGRNVFKNINENKYKSINVKKIMLKNFMNTTYLETEKYVNNEIEDLLYPEIIVQLINSILKRKNMNIIDEEVICKKIEKPAFVKSGILSLCENEKNSMNLDTGNMITFYPSSNTGFKKSMALLFDLKANISLLEMLEKCDEKHPFVREFLTELLDYQDM